VNYIPITKPTIEEEEINNMNEVLTSGMLVYGRHGKEVESKLQLLCNRKYAVLLPSGTTSLNIAVSILGLKSEDEVITTPFTFISSASCILTSGAKVVFADIDPQSFNINPQEIEKKITKKTKAIISVDLFGNPANYEKIEEICRKNKLLLIEDAAQAHGAEFKNKLTGSFGDISIFSFYGSKVITSGEGGALLYDSKDLYDKALLMRNHGQSDIGSYQYLSLGHNYMMPDTSASILNAQLTKLDLFIKVRRNIASIYKKQLSGILGLTLPEEQVNCKHAYSCFTVRLDKAKYNRDKILKNLNEKGIGARVYYPISLHLHPLWKDFDYEFKKGMFPEAERASLEVLSLPIYPKLSQLELERIIESLVKILRLN